MAVCASDLTIVSAQSQTSGLVVVGLLIDTLYVGMIEVLEMIAYSVKVFRHPPFVSLKLLMMAQNKYCIQIFYSMEIPAFKNRYFCLFLYV